MKCPLDSLARLSALVAVTFIVPASGLYAQVAKRSSLRDAHVILQTDQSSYHSGDSIRVRLTLRNVSSHSVRFPPISLPGLVRLQVYDADGNRIKPGAPLYTSGGGGPNWDLDPGEERTLKGWTGHEWLNLRDWWGYGLRAPGQYTIIGIPMLAGPGPMVDTETKPDAETMRSIQTTITIKP